LSSWCSRTLLRAVKSNTPGQRTSIEERDTWLFVLLPAELNPQGRQVFAHIEGPKFRAYDINGGRTSRPNIKTTQVLQHFRIRTNLEAPLTNLQKRSGIGGLPVVEQETGYMIEVVLVHELISLGAFPRERERMICMRKYRHLLFCAVWTRPK